MKSKHRFIGTCDRIRQDPTGEKWWHNVMKKRKPISESTFLKNVNPIDILDPDESWQSFVKEQKRQDNISFYKSDDTYFFQTSGFEYFWRKKK